MSIHLNPSLIVVVRDVRFATIPGDELEPSLALQDLHQPLTQLRLATDLRSAATPSFRQRHRYQPPIGELLLNARAPNLLPLTLPNSEFGKPSDRSPQAPTPI